MHDVHNEHDPDSEPKIMSTRARGIRLPDELDREVEREMERSGRGWSEVVVEFVREAVRMRRAPGIVFTAGPTGRRATIAGTGLDVWEIVAAWKAAGEDAEALAEDYPWLDPIQLRAALNYYSLYSDEIDARLEREEAWTKERLAAELPFASSLSDD